VSISVPSRSRGRSPVDAAPHRHRGLALAPLADLDARCRHGLLQLPARERARVARVAQALEPVVIAAAVDQVDDGHPPAGPAQARHLAQDCRRVLHVMEREPGDDDVELIGQERHVGRIPAHEEHVAPALVGRRPRPGLEHLRHHVEDRARARVAREEPSERSGPPGGVEHAILAADRCGVSDPAQELLVAEPPLGPLEVLGLARELASKLLVHPGHPRVGLGVIPDGQETGRPATCPP